MGLIFVPMNLIAFATLSPVLRTDGSAMFNLVRNVGSAIGVSITTTMLANSIQTMHAQLAGNVNPFNRALSVNAPSMLWNPHLPFGVAQLDSIVAVQRADHRLCERLPVHVLHLAARVVRAVPDAPPGAPAAPARDRGDGVGAENRGFG